MKKKIIFILSILSFLTFNIHTTVKLEKIGVINLIQIIEEVYKNKNEQIKTYIEVKKNLQNELNQIKTEIINKQNKLKESKNQNSELQNEINTLKEKYVNTYKNKIPEIEQYEKTFLSLYSNEIFEYVRRYSEKNGYTLILKHNSDNIFYYAPLSDISQDIIKSMLGQ